MDSLKQLVKHTPLLKSAVESLRRVYKQTAFVGSQAFWEQHYAQGGTSGAGSYGKYAEFKADILNRFVQENSVRSVIEFGCGDGNQLSLARYPSYVRTRCI